MKKILIGRVVGILVAVVFLAGLNFLLFSRSVSKREIVQMVEDNVQLLQTYIDTGDFETNVPLEGVGRASVYQDSETSEAVCILFSCSKSTFGRTTTRGFYYSQDGIFEFGGPPKPDGDGWSWKSDSGQTSYYTENITGNFYYYEHKS